MFTHCLALPVTAKTCQIELEPVLDQNASLHVKAPHKATLTLGPDQGRHEILGFGRRALLDLFGIAVFDCLSARVRVDESTKKAS